jgi:tetratricopeptide (TPR) repeat protein
MFGAVNNLAVSAQFAGHFEQELELRHRALDIARRLDRAPILAFATGNLALPLLYLGRWREARGYCDESLQLFAAQGESWYAAYPRVYLGRLLFSQGRRAAARKHLEAALDITARSGDLQAGRHVRSLLAEHDLYLGRPDQALARLEPVLDRTGQEEEWVTRLLPVVARTKLALGRPEEADELLSYAAERALRQNHRLALVKIKRARGDLYGELQQWDRAQQALAEGRALAADMPYPFAEARVLHSLGLSLMTQGDRSAAREALEEALGLFQFLGATEWAEHSRGLLTRLRR